MIYDAIKLNDEYGGKSYRVIGKQMLSKLD
jgi:hypothetical protein